MENEPDRAVPPGSGVGARDPAVSCLGKMGEARALVVPLRREVGWSREKKGKRKCGPRGGRGEFPFPFSKFVFCSNLLKSISKPL